MSKSSRASKHNRTQASSSDAASVTMNVSFERKQKYKSLLSKGVELNERVENNECSNTLAHVKSLIEQSNAVSKEVNESSGSSSLANASENVMDATVMKIGHEIIGIVANKLGQNEFAENVYADKILGSISNGTMIEWSLFASKTLHIVKMPRFSQTMVGAFEFQADPVTKAKKERVVRRKQAETEVKRPEKVQNLQKEEKGAQLLQVVKSLIEKEFIRRKYTPIPYYELILDPDDFMHTIDNAFQVAFLVRDGNIGLSLGENNEPLIYVPTKEEQDLKRREKKTTQGVVGISYTKWMEIKRRYEDMGEPILKLNRGEFIPQSQNLTQRMDH